MDPVYSEKLESAKATRPDIIAFGVAFVVGVMAYSLLQWFGVHQIVISVVIAAVMIAYSVVVARIPRLRIRLDQAGDNAYYLGLLFTLISMAVALYQFGNAVEGTGTQDEGAKQIIRNFGIALFSTITGIFLRLVMHQMRVDPADVENMTRIELADASRMVKAKLNAVSLELASFCTELQQRTGDVVDALLKNVRVDLARFSAETAHATERMVQGSVNAQTRITKTLANSVTSLGEIADEARGAIERLKAIEQPPTTFAARLGKASGALETLGETVRQIGPELEGMAESLSQSSTAMDSAAERVVAFVAEGHRSHTETLAQVAGVATQLKETLSRLAKDLQLDRELLRRLELQAAESAKQASAAQEATAQVLLQLTAATGSLASAVGNVAKPESRGH